MFRNCKLPPLYRLITVEAGADTAAEARRMAASGAGPATVICAAREDRLDCAVILHPDLPAAEARLAIYLLALGVGDALGAVVPAGIDVTYRWPNVIEANIGAVARVAIDLPEAAADGDVAGWMVARATVVIGALPGEGLRQGFPETSLHDEGCVEVTTAGLLESFARHLLVWVNRWQDDGFGPIRAMWLRHAPGHGETVTIDAGGEQYTGVFDGIDDDGALVLKRDGTEQRVALDAAFSEPSC